MIESQPLPRESQQPFRRRVVAFGGYWSALATMTLRLALRLTLRLTLCSSVCLGFGTSIAFAQRDVLNFDLADAVNLDAASNT
ncbi:MAG: hypothetical protein ACI9HK_000812, partial [Pirellulaceae bacterium]